ncbi:MAG TPA: DUF2071 domain-containing protein [Longimicrobiales bacterium]|nr:DUF2071 domain-containing protein [Longimicrobiales bacterium]
MSAANRVGGKTGASDVIEHALSVTAHRPWPLPSGPWIMYQRWERLLFAHWPIDVTELRGLVPPPLVIDQHEGRAWVGITPFHLSELRGRGLPRVPGASSFPELNVRTYVRLGDRPGVFFFSLDAGSLLAVGAARTAYALPYHHANMSIEQHGEWLHYHCARDSRAAFEGRYRPVGEEFTAAPGSLEAFLVERYALYTVPRPNRTHRADIHHAPWRIRSAEAEITRNTMADAAGIRLPDRAPLLHYAERQDVVVWPPKDPSSD